MEHPPVLVLQFANFMTKSSPYHAKKNQPRLSPEPLAVRLGKRGLCPHTGVPAAFPCDLPSATALLHPPFMASPLRVSPEGVTTPRGGAAPAGAPGQPGPPPPGQPGPPPPRRAQEEARQQEIESRQHMRRRMDAVLALKNSITANRVGARPRAPTRVWAPHGRAPPAGLGPDPASGRRSAPACRSACPAPPSGTPAPRDVGPVSLSLSPGSCGRPPRICCPQVCAGTSQAPESRGKKAPRPRPPSCGLVLWEER